MSKLVDFLAADRDAIFSQWLDLTLHTYAPDTVVLWKKNKDPFTNPVCNKFEEGMGSILDGLVRGDPVDASTFGPALDEIVRVRAVQDFTPSQAMAFIFLLKKAVRETLWPHVAEHELFVELLALESKIDILIQLALDIYSQCREKLMQLRITQVRNQYDRLLKRANLVCDLSPEGEEP